MDQSASNVKHVPAHSRISTISNYINKECTDQEPSNVKCASRRSRGKVVWKNTNDGYTNQGTSSAKRVSRHSRASTIWGDRPGIFEYKTRLRKSKTRASVAWTRHRVDHTDVARRVWLIIRFVYMIVSYSFCVWYCTLFDITVAYSFSKFSFLLIVWALLWF